MEQHWSTGPLHHRPRAVLPLSRSSSASSRRKARNKPLPLPPATRAVRGDSPVGFLTYEASVADSASIDSPSVNSVAHAYQSDHEFQDEVVRCLDLLKMSLVEVESWQWDGDFDTRCQSANTLLHPDLASAQQLWPGKIEDIRNKMHKFDLEKQKNYVVTSYEQVVPDFNGLSAHFRATPLCMDEETATVTATVLQALSHHSRLASLLDMWSARVKVLDIGPSFLQELKDSYKHLEEAWRAVGARFEEDGRILSVANLGSSGLFRGSFEAMQTGLQQRASKLDNMVETMLDALEEQPETLPEDWLDSVEEFETGIHRWTAVAEQRVVQYELRLDVAMLPSAAPLAAFDSPVLQKAADADGSDNISIPGAWQDFDSETTVVQPANNQQNPYETVMPRDYPEIVFDFPWALKQPSFNSPRSSLSKRSYVHSDNSRAPSPLALPRIRSSDGWTQFGYPNSDAASENAYTHGEKRKSVTSLHELNSSQPHSLPRGLRPLLISSPSSHSPGFHGFTAPLVPEATLGGAIASQHAGIDIPEHDGIHDIPGLRKLRIHERVRARSVELKSIPLYKTHARIASGPGALTMAKLLADAQDDSESEVDETRKPLHYKKASCTSIESHDKSEVRSIEIRRSMASLTSKTAGSHSQLRRWSTTHAKFASAARPPLERNSTAAPPKSVSAPAVPTVMSANLAEEPAEEPADSRGFEQENEAQDVDQTPDIPIRSPRRSPTTTSPVVVSYPAGIGIDNLPAIPLRKSSLHTPRYRQSSATMSSCTSQPSQTPNPDAPASVSSRCSSPSEARHVFTPRTAVYLPSNIRRSKPSPTASIPASPPIPPIRSLTGSSDRRRPSNTTLTPSRSYHGESSPFPISSPPARIDDLHGLVSSSTAHSLHLGTNADASAQPSTSVASSTSASGSYRPENITREKRLWLASMVQLAKQHQMAKSAAATAAQRSP